MVSKGKSSCDSQAEMGEGLMMVSYGYSGAGKTTTLSLCRTQEYVL